MGFIETESESEFSRVLVEVRVEESVAGVPKFLLHGTLGEFSGEPGEQNAFLSFLQLDVTVAEEPHSRSTKGPCGLCYFSALRCQVPGGSYQANGRLKMLINNGVVVQVHSNGFISVPSDVIIRRVLPPLVESRVVIRVEELVVESQTETGAGQSIRPNFCVFTMTTHMSAMPLFSKVAHNPGMSPTEGVISISNHFEWFIPLWVIGNISMQAE